MTIGISTAPSWRYGIAAEANDGRIGFRVGSALVHGRPPELSVEADGAPTVEYIALAAGGRTGTMPPLFGDRCNRFE